MALGHWGIGAPGHWGTGALGHWGIGALGHWGIGAFGALGHWGVGALGVYLLLLLGDEVSLLPEHAQLVVGVVALRALLLLQLLHRAAHLLELSAALVHLPLAG